MLRFTLFSTALSVYFYLPQGAEKCFLEDVADHNLLIVSYELFERNPPLEVNEAISCTIGLSQTIGGPIIEHASRTLTNFTKGKIAAEMNDVGEHYACIKCIGPKHWMTSEPLYKWRLSFDVVREDFHDKTVEEKQDEHSVVKKLTDNAITLNSIIKHLDGVAEQMKYQSRVELEFRDQNELANSRVLHFSIAQIILLFACTSLQVYHLGNFLKESFKNSRYLPLGGYKT